MSKYTLEEFNAARDAALLSLDEEKIRDFSLKFNERQLPYNTYTFWGSVHKAPAMKSNGRKLYERNKATP